MYEENTKKLNEFIEYKNSLDDRIDEFKKEIEKKEVEFKELQEQYTADFMGGKTPNDKKLKSLKNDIETDKEQLVLIIDAMNEEPKLRELAQEVFTEHIALQIKIKQDLAKDSEEIQEAEKTYTDKVNEIIQRKYSRVVHEKENATERLKAVDYMDIDDKRKKRLIFLANDSLWDYIPKEKQRFNV